MKKVARPRISPERPAKMNEPPYQRQASETERRAPQQTPVPKTGRRFPKTVAGMAHGPAVFNPLIRSVKVESLLRRHSLIEYLSDIEHQQWRGWVLPVLINEKLSRRRREKWQSHQIPYEQLEAPVKEIGRQWARRLMEAVLAEPRPAGYAEMVERIAEQEYFQWKRWAETVLNEEHISRGRRIKWMKRIEAGSYGRQNEEQKEFDRHWARPAADLICENL